MNNKKAMLYFWILLLVSCHKYDVEIRNALELSGKNKGELIKVLEYYKKEGDSMKLEAAKFLISNLPYNYSYDTTNLKKYRIIPLMAKSQWEQDDSIDPNKLNKLWDSLKIISPAHTYIYSKPVQEDIKFVTSKFLIKNIDDAYNSWRNNPYARDSVSFEDFCEYILPYRHIQGKALENWRDFFKSENEDHFKDLYPIPFTKACDSLFGQYKTYKFNYELTEGLPILKFKDFMKIKSGKCTVKSWFNTYIVNTEGIPMVVDFVPAWGNKEDNHQWNALLYGGRTLYFESYWEKGHSWFYNPDINNNKFEDDWSGKIRLPKVYRHTFSTHMEGPISDKRIKLENIPQLFRNVKQKDVSNDYFNTINLSHEITKEKIPKNTYYAYLSVLGVNKRWVPVQWGKIEGNMVIFNKMGTDIVYQPIFYKNGRTIPFGTPFHLDHNGNKKEFIPGNSTSDVVIKRKYPAKKGLEKDAKRIKGSLIQASNNRDFRDAVTIEQIDFEPELRPYEIPLNIKKKYRYFRILSRNVITIKEIKLSYQESENKEIQLEGNFITSSPSTENDSTTWKGIDLKKKQYVSKITFAPPNNLNHVLKGLNYELFYVDKGVFVSLGQQKAEDYELKYKNVPKNGLLYLKCLDEGRQERIFEYKNGEQIWY
ncbi:hypothetical protein [Sinomicrobium weinanense]|uniref:Discoidin domain-containing protein n=1 Tax=Sinomicrobium weinanense TaxID=2842200 RepID=A0A926JUJ7_9FLAO|nr:hypothetical protein [Sinomicrobium weinanense]MBC9797818.1 hypothetical protein [Sinomicrobium weinanense]MBU3125967.1 hypothetical protein [Sinomicrobium weinanense]